MGYSPDPQKPPEGQPWAYPTEAVLMRRYASYLYTCIQPNFFAGQKFRPFTEIFHGIDFYPCGKDHHRFYAIINMEQKNLRDKISPMRAGGKKK